MPSPTSSAVGVPVQPAQANRMLVLATTGFLLNFWAWALLSPLGPAYRDELDLTSFQQAFLVAIPVLVGSLGRIPVGALTDRFGARVMFPAVSILTVLPVLFVGLVADSYALLVLGGFFLGIGGTAFAVGVPLVNSWFAKERRGFALGLFGMGTAGTAISAFTTVRLSDAFSREVPFLLVAVLLSAYAVVAYALVRDVPRAAGPAGSFLRRTWTVARRPVTLQLSALYALGFGGFVAFSVYLPTHLKNTYDLTQGDAAARTAGFVVLAVLARPLGGWLSDKLHPVPVLTVCFTATGLLAVLAALELELMPAGTVAFLGMAAALGAASGAVFALVARLAPPDQVGAVTGIVGAAGGLGGFVPPLVMGAVYGQYGDYTIGLLLLAVVALAMAVFTWWPVRRSAAQH